MEEGGRNKKAGATVKAAKTNHNGTIPHGRDAVKKAILDATEKLLLKKSPNKITVREIAEAANIKHPLIHRHFETKEKVILAVHARRIADIEKRVEKIEDVEGNIATFFEAVKKIKFRRIAIARAMMDGVSPRTIQTEFPVMKRLLELITKKFDAKKGAPAFSPEMITAVLSATALGWFLYEPYLLASVNMEEKRQGELDETVVEILEELVRHFAELKRK
jgi:TetR/AcrR family transcriptional regulator, repressor for neighboring sulfatase